MGRILLVQAGLRAVRDQAVERRREEEEARRAEVATDDMVEERERGGEREGEVLSNRKVRRREGGAHSRRAGSGRPFEAGRAFGAAAGNEAGDESRGTSRDVQRGWLLIGRVVWAAASVSGREELGSDPGDWVNPAPAVPTVVLDRKVGREEWTQYVSRHEAGRQALLGGKAGSGAAMATAPVAPGVERGRSVDDICPAGRGDGSGQMADAGTVPVKSLNWLLRSLPLQAVCAVCEVRCRTIGSATQSCSECTEGHCVKTLPGQRGREGGGGQPPADLPHPPARAPWFHAGESETDCSTQP